MRRIQIYIEEAMDDALAVQAARRSTSKAALIREALAGHVPDGVGVGEPGGDIVGWIEQDLPSSANVDDVVYGR